MPFIPETPATLAVRVVCPECKQALQLDMEVESQLTVTTDMDGVIEKTLKPKVKVQSIAHACFQRTLDDVLPTDTIVDEAVRRINAGELGPDVTAKRVK